jgi:hypothetical protein
MLLRTTAEYARAKDFGSNMTAAGEESWFRNASQVAQMTRAAAKFVHRAVNTTIEHLQWPNMTDVQAEAADLLQGVIDQAMFLGSESALFETPVGESVGQRSVQTLSFREFSTDRRLVRQVATVHSAPSPHLGGRSPLATWRFSRWSSQN